MTPVSPKNSQSIGCLTWNVHGSGIETCIDALQLVVDKALSVVFLQEVACESGITLQDSMHDWWWVSFGPDVTQTHRGCGCLLNKGTFSFPHAVEAVPHFCFCVVDFQDEAKYSGMILLCAHLPCETSGLTALTQVWMKAQECYEKLLKPLRCEKYVTLLGGDLNIELAQQCDDTDELYCIGGYASAQLAAASLATMGMSICPQSVEQGPIPTRIGWQGQNHRPRALDWFACSSALSVCEVCGQSNEILHSDHLAVFATFDLVFKATKLKDTTRKFSHKGFNIWSNDDRAAYNQDITEISAFFDPMWKAWCMTQSFGELLDHDVTDHMFLAQVMTYDELIQSFNSCLEKAFLRYATRPPRICFVESDDLKMLQVTRRDPSISKTERTRLSKQVLQVRKRERMNWKTWLISQAAQGSWRHKRVLSRLDDRGRMQHLYIPLQLVDIQGQFVQYVHFANAALAAVESVSTSHDLFLDSDALVKVALANLAYSCRNDDPFTNLEFGQALLGLSCGKAMGSDNLISEAFKLLGYDSWSTFLEWCNRVFLGILPWPEVWNKALIHYIPKCRVPHSIKDFRPISITAIGYKVFMRMVNARLAQQVGGNVAGQSAGYAGCQVHSILTTLHVLSDKAREWKLPLYLLSWDFAKAFDSLEWHAILTLLQDKQVSKAVQRAIILGFSQQCSKVTIYGQTSDGECFPGRGIKQGAPESSAVFSMVVDHVLSGLQTQSPTRDALFSGDFAFSHTLAWVDDLYLMTSSLREMQSLVDQVLIAFGSVGLEPNLSKLRLLRSEAAHSGHVQVHTQMLQTEEPDKDIRILGMQFSLKRGVAPHLEYAISRAWKVFSANKRVLCDKTVNFSQRVYILNMLVQPVLLWCSCNWTPNKTMVARLNTVHVKMLSHMWSTARHAGQTWLDAHRVRFRAMWARVRASSLNHGAPFAQLYAWGLRFLQNRHGWIGHAFRHFGCVLKAFQWRSFHWWWHQQQESATQEDFFL